MGPHDFAYQARRAAQVTYATSGSDDLTTNDLFNTTDGFFLYGIDQLTHKPAFNWKTGWKDFGSKPTLYDYDTPDGWGSYNLWKHFGKTDDLGYYKAEKLCADGACWLEFWCLDDNGDLYTDC